MACNWFKVQGSVAIENNSIYNTWTNTIGTVFGDIEAEQVIDVDFANLINTLIYT
jgi:hypothetical protein